jgi:formylglycine-generating enzyme required for sulfatase activity
VAEVDRLWPAVPDRVPAMRAWLVRAGAFTEQLEPYQAALAEQRRRALPYTPEDRARDAATHPGLAHHADLCVVRETRRFYVARGGPEEARRAAELAAVEEEIATLERELEARRTWRFSDEREQWQHDKLAELVGALEFFVEDSGGLKASVEERLVFAEALHERSIDEPAAAWAQARAAIADPELSPWYAGLELAPQLGLVPLGPDPESGLWEFAHLATGEAPVRGVDGRLAIDEDSGVVLVLVPGGRTTIGARRAAPGEAAAPYADPEALLSEAPVHEVELAPYFLSKFELTQGQWLRVLGLNPSQFLPGQVHGPVPNDLTHPVESVSWEQARVALERMALTLPTEARWEHGARAGSSTPWWTGSDPGSLEGAANLADITAKESGAPWPDLRDGGSPWRDGWVAHAPVGSYRANAFGLHDTAGNVWEWCSDDIAEYVLPTLPGDGARLHRLGDRRMGRGGSFANLPVTLRTSHRGGAEPGYRDMNLGVRPARDVDG